MFLANLSDDIWRELSILRDLFGFSKEYFLHQRVNLDVVIHFVQLAEYKLVVRVRSEVVNRIIFDFHLQNA